MHSQNPYWHDFVFILALPNFSRDYNVNNRIIVVKKQNNGRLQSFPIHKWGISIISNLIGTKLKSIADIILQRVFECN